MKCEVGWWWNRSNSVKLTLHGQHNADKNWAVACHWLQELKHQQLIQQQQQWWWECYLLQTIFLLVAAIQWLYTIAFIVSSFACFQHVNLDIMRYIGILFFSLKTLLQRTKTQNLTKDPIFWDTLYNALAFVLPLFHDFYGKW